MPDRIIRANILSSERVNAVSWGAEVFYRRLMSVVDDYGRYDGRPAILRAQLYPLKLDRVAEPDIGKWIRECEEAALVRIYTVDTKLYLEILRFGAKLRSASKWPDPPTLADNCQQLRPYSYAYPNAYAGSVPPADQPAVPALELGPTAADIYAAYPRKVAKADALKAIEKAMKKTPSVLLLAKAQAYDEAVQKWPEDERRFIPHPATWFNRGSYDDDPKTWERKPNGTHQKPNAGRNGRSFELRNDYSSVG